MALDAVKNFAKVTVSLGYAAGVTTIVLSTGDGAKLPQPSTDGLFNLVWWNSTDYGDPTDDPNVEIVRCTARSTDTLTVTRAQEGTADANHNTGGKAYKMILSPTAKMITDIGAAYDPAGTGNTEATDHVSTHAALLTGVHGLAITAGQTLTVTTGGTIGSAAYTASTDYATSGHNHAGVYDPAGTGNTEATGHVSAHENSYNHTNFGTAYTHSQAVTGAEHGAVSANTANMIVRRGASGEIAVGAATITGAITATGNITAYYSDERLKKIEGNIQNALDKVMTLNGFHYRGNALSERLGYESVPDVGVSAQQVQRVLPEAVVAAPINPDYLTVRYDRLIPLLIEAIKEMKNEIDALRFYR